MKTRQLDLEFEPEVSEKRGKRHSKKNESSESPDLKEEKETAPQKTEALKASEKEALPASERTKKKSKTTTKAEVTVEENPVPPAPEKEEKVSGTGTKKTAVRKAKGTPKKKPAKKSSTSVAEPLKDFIQFKVKAQLGRPYDIWVELLVPLDGTYKDLADEIDRAFLLSSFDYHLHMFIMGKGRGAPQILCDRMKEDNWDDSPVESDVYLKDYLPSKFFFIWDLGDNWVFWVKPQKIVQAPAYKAGVIREKGIFDPFKLNAEFYGLDEEDF